MPIKKQKDSTKKPAKKVLKKEQAKDSKKTGGAIKHVEDSEDESVLETSSDEEFKENYDEVDDDDNFGWWQPL